MSETSTPENAEQIVADVPCPFCACLCDDLQLTVRGGRIVAAAKACKLAEPQFLAAGAIGGAICRIDGRPANLEEAVQRAIEILQMAHYPLIWGLGRATCEAQAAAVEIAERCGGIVDPSGDRDLEALQTVGEVTCTLGEIRRRADFLLLWNADPAADQPRFFERYAPPSLGKPGGCPLMVVDSRTTETARMAARHLKIHAGSEFESATMLRALARGLSPDAAIAASQTGVPLDEWRSLFSRMEESRYGVILYGESTEIASISPLHRLVRMLNDRARWVGVRLGEASNGNGAAQVLAWRTGYPRAADFSHGFPRYGPTDFAAEQLLARGEVDAALVVCDDSQLQLSSAAQAHLQKIPRVLIDWQETPGWSDADVAIRVAVPGVESSGTMFRMDGVPLALRPALAAKCPADFEVLRMLLAALTDSGQGSDSFFGR